MKIDEYMKSTERPVDLCKEIDDLRAEIQMLRNQNNMLTCFCDECESKLNWKTPDIKPEIGLPILFVAFDEYVSGKYLDDEQWNSVGILYYTTDQIEKWSYLPKL